MLIEMLALGSGRFLVGSVLFLYRMSFVLVELLVVRMLVVFGSASQRLTRKHFDWRTNRGRQ